MGDRGNVVILDWTGTQAVVLYTHWGGTELPQAVQAALAKRWRWTDGAYLARIVFDVMTDGEHGLELSFGISANTLCDNEHPLLVLDPETQRVAVRLDEANFLGRVGPEEGWSFEEYVTLDLLGREVDWRQWHDAYWAQRRRSMDAGER